MGKRVSALACALAVGLPVCPPAVAAPAAAHAVSKASILEPMTVTNITPLSFGSLASSAAGTVTLTPRGAVSYTGGATGLGGTITTADFIAVTTGSRMVKIKLPKGVIPLTRVGGGATMSVSALTDVRKNSKTTATGTLHEFSVGGTLNLGANQAEGNYEGRLDVTFDFN